MSNLISITDVRFYCGFSTPTAVNASFDCKNFLDNLSIPYGILMYTDNASYDSLFANLSTWVFGLTFRQYTFTDFPIVTWTETYDDYSVVSEAVTTLTDLQNSNLVNYKNLINAS